MWARPHAVSSCAYSSLIPPTVVSQAVFPERQSANAPKNRISTGTKAPIKNPFEDLDNDGDGDVIV